MIELISGYMSYIRDNNSNVEKLMDDFRKADDTMKESLLQYMFSVNGRMLGYETELKAMQGQYDEWLFHQEYAQKVRENFGKEAASYATPEEGYFGNHPFKAIKDYFARHPKTKLLYGDEDCKLKDGAHGKPWFRPDWSPDLYLSAPYFGNVAVIRREFLDEVKEGVESQNQLEILKEKNCDLVQGFIWGTPLEIHEVRSLCDKTE